jgi:hypothetical protein
VVLGHAVMCLIAGRASADRLAGQPLEAAQKLVAAEPG